MSEIEVVRRKLEYIGAVNVGPSSSCGVVRYLSWSGEKMIEVQTPHNSIGLRTHEARDVASLLLQALGEQAPLSFAEIEDAHDEVRRAEQQRCLNIVKTCYDQRAGPPLDIVCRMLEQIAEGIES